MFLVSVLEFIQEVGNSFGIGGDVKITVVESKSGQVKLGIDAPRSVSVNREEVHKRMQKENGKKDV